MKNRPRDKKAGILILAALIVLSAVEVIFRFGCLKEVAYTTSNVGEPFATMLFAALLLFFTLSGKDRAGYICFGVLIGWFAMDQIIEFPGAVYEFVQSVRGISLLGSIGAINMILRLLNMVTVIGIGALLVEYMNDGTIYNKAFNILCIAAVAILVVSIVMDLYVAITISKTVMLSVFNNAYRLIMVCMTTFFAYDSAKRQLKKTRLS